MSILIRGMEMPKACRECPLETDYGTCGYYSLYVEAGHDSDYEKRRDDCPLIELPPHGRLIDADELIKVFKAHHDLFPEDGGIFELAERDAFQLSIADVVNAPTIIPAEEAEA